MNLKEVLEVVERGAPIVWQDVNEIFYSGVVAETPEPGTDTLKIINTDKRIYPSYMEFKVSKKTENLKVAILLPGTLEKKVSDDELNAYLKEKENPNFISRVINQLPKLKENYEPIL